VTGANTQPPIAGDRKRFDMLQQAPLVLTAAVRSGEEGTKRCAAMA
jgi:hypothetical protein